MLLCKHSYTTMRKPRIFPARIPDANAWFAPGRQLSRCSIEFFRWRHMQGACRCAASNPAWVSALLIGFCFLHLHFDLAVVWLCCFAFCKIIPNSSAHKLSAMMGHFHYGVTVSLVVWCLLACCLVCFGSVVVGFLFRYHPVVDSGLYNGSRSTFDSPMWDAYSCSFISTYSVWRPGKSHRGVGRKKKSRYSIAALVSWMVSSTFSPLIDYTVLSII